MNFDLFKYYHNEYLTQLIVIRIGEVFEVKTGIIGSKQNLYEDGSISETDLSSDTSEVNGILPSKPDTKENSYIPSALISFNDDRCYNQNDIRRTVRSDLPKKGNNSLSKPLESCMRLMCPYHQYTSINRILTFISWLLH